jgi:hypothetical protein
MSKTCRTNAHLWVPAVIILSVVAALLLPLQTSQALSPRPGKPAPVKARDDGGTIKLLTRFSSSWPWNEANWQDIWTVVQWRDDKGIWHDVDGWQGTLDAIDTNAGKTVVGFKSWWVDAPILGKGPFRWQVYHSKGSWLLATSDTFDLPEVSGAVVTVEVDLAP